MIVTCPSCEANFRVHNDKVPEEGARMRCARCATEFLAKLPEREHASPPAEPPPPKTPPPQTPATGMAPPRTPPHAPTGMGPPRTPPGSFLPPFGPKGSTPAAVSGAFAPLTPRPNPFAKLAPPPPEPPPPAAAPPPPAPEPPPPAAAPPPPAPAPPPPPPEPAPPSFSIPREVTGIFSLPDLEAPSEPEGPTLSAEGDLGGVLFDSEDDPFAHIEPYDDLDPEPPPEPAPAVSPSAGSPWPASPPSASSLLEDNPDLFPATPAPEGNAMRARLQSAMESANRGGALKEEGSLAGRTLPPPALSDPFAEVVPPSGPPPKPTVREEPRPVTLAEPAAERGPSSLWAGLTWGALVVSMAAFVVGLGLAGWTHGIVDLTPRVLPLLEEHAAVHPVRSTLGRDQPKLEVLLQAAGVARDGDDLALEAVAWRRVLLAAPGHEAAAARLKKVLDLLGEGQALPELR